MSQIVSTWRNQRVEIHCSISLEVEAGLINFLGANVSLSSRIFRLNLEHPVLYQR